MRNICIQVVYIKFTISIHLPCMQHKMPNISITFSIKGDILNDFLFILYTLLRLVIGSKNL